MLEAKNLDKEISVKKIDNETINIKIFNNNILMAIVGEFNKNLIEISLFKFFASNIKLLLLFLFFLLYQIMCFCYTFVF